MALSDWMADYQNRRLAELHLPGSHDAGTVKGFVDLTRLGTVSNAVTQNLTITQQLAAGTRFFDLRLASNWTGQVVPHHTTLRQGAYGKVSVDTTLVEAAQWCSAHGTEVAIFRISHTDLATNAHEIAKRSGRGSLHTGNGNLATKTLAEITREGGGMVCIFDEESFAGVINQGDGIHSFSKYEKQQVNDRGLSICGVYEGTHTLDTVIGNGLRGQYQHNVDHFEGMRSHLWQLYGQKTYINPASRTGIESGATRAFSQSGGKAHGGTHAATDHMIQLMTTRAGAEGEDYTLQKEKSHPEGFFRKKVVDKQKVLMSTRPARNFMLPNIFSYDFVNVVQNQKIVDLNRP